MGFWTSAPADARETQKSDPVVNSLVSGAQNLPDTQDARGESEGKGVPLLRDCRTEVRY
jgi:hypothetical protein